MDLILLVVLLLVARRPRPEDVVVVSLNPPDRWSSRTLETIVVITELINILKCVLVDSLVLRHVSEETRKDMAKLTLYV